jgi:vacuole morphology and inheritance protein 14
MAAKDREKDYGPLPPLIAKGLNDKLYEKRKTAALDLERTIKELNALGDWKQIDDIAFVLNQEFIQIPNANSKKGGLIGLAATAIALGIVNRLCNNVNFLQIQYTSLCLPGGWEIY